MKRNETVAVTAAIYAVYVLLCTTMTTTIIINGMLARALGGGKEKKRKKRREGKKKRKKKTATGVCEGSVDGSGRVRERFKSPARALGPGDPSVASPPEGARRGARRRVCVL